MILCRILCFGLWMCDGEFKDSSGDISLVGSLAVLGVCNRFELCSLIAVMLTIIGVY